MMAHADEQQHRREHLAQRLLQALGDVVDVVGDPAQQVAALLLVDVAERQGVDLVLDVGAQLEHQPLDDAGEHVGGDERRAPTTPRRARPPRAARRCSAVKSMPWWRYTPWTMMSVAWPSTLGPNTLSVALATATTSTTIEHDPHRARACRSGAGATFLKSFDRSPGTPAEFQRPGRARLGRREVELFLVLVFLLVVDERHAASLFSPICDCTISAYVGQSRSSSSWVPRPMTTPSSSTRMSSAVAMVDTRWATMTTADVLGVRAERGAQAGVGREVERRERVVEHVDVGPANQGPGDRQSLALTARHVGAALFDPCVEAAGHRADEVGGLRDLERAPTSPPRWRRACRTAGCWRPCPRRGRAAAARGRSCSTARRGRGRARRPRRRAPCRRCCRTGAG